MPLLTPALPEHSRSFPTVQTAALQYVPFLPVMLLPMRLPAQPSAKQPSADRSPPITTLGNAGIGDWVDTRRPSQFLPFTLPLIVVNPAEVAVIVSVAPG